MPNKDEILRALDKVAQMNYPGLREAQEQALQEVIDTYGVAALYDKANN